MSKTHSHYIFSLHGAVDTQHVFDRDLVLCTSEKERERYEPVARVTVPDDGRDLRCMCHKGEKSSRLRGFDASEVLAGKAGPDVAVQRWGEPVSDDPADPVVPRVERFACAVIQGLLAFEGEPADDPRSRARFGRAVWEIAEAIEEAGGEQ